MGTIQKLGVAIIGVALVTTMVLPKRQSPQVIGAISSGGRGILSTAMTGSTKA